MNDNLNPKDIFKSQEISSKSNQYLFNSNEKMIKSTLPKPDLSPLIKKENTFELKTHGSYKKPKVLFPESPMKSPNQKYFTPGKITGKNLFGNSDGQNVFRKLNFDAEPQEILPPKKKFTDLLDNVEEKDEDFSSPNQPKDTIFSISSSHPFQSTDQLYNNINDDNNNNIKESKLDTEFLILKRIADSRYSSVYICKRKEEINMNKIYAVKKSLRNSIKNSYATIQKLYQDFNNNTISPYAKFCAIYKEYWFEDDDITESFNNNTSNDNNNIDDINDVLMEDAEIKLQNRQHKHLFILSDYYSNGDLLDYLSKLERENYKFTSDFYWDIIFEMLCGVLFIHQCGYLHLDIKPANFLVDSFGYVLIGDFGLSQKLSDLQWLNDIYEGDSIYLAPEVFYRKSLKDLDYKGDVYSLGLSILEILAKIELPQNGTLWRELRSPGFTMPKEFLVNWNISDIQPFIKLISKMITQRNERVEIMTLLTDMNNFPQLGKRYQMNLNNSYIKSSQFFQFNCQGNSNNPSFNIGMSIQNPKQSPYLNGFKFS